MAIPDFQSCMLPLLRAVSNRAVYSAGEIEHILAVHFGLTEHELSELLPSGRQRIFRNRIAWAKSYLKQAGLLASPKRGLTQITDNGMGVLDKNPSVVNIKLLEQFPAFVEFRAGKSGDDVVTQAAESTISQNTPEEVLELAYEKLRIELSQELLAKILSCSPEFFEYLVVELLLKMGYGGSRRDAGERIGQSGDGGIDGIIKEDRLGLDVIYIQAKRWQGSVGRPEIQKFVGALQGQRARKGVFITTSMFTSDAKIYAENIDTKVVLIDGTRLANFMIDFDVGVSVSASYVVKKIDFDYFEED